MQFHYPLDPKKILAEGSMHKDTTYQGSDRQDFYRHGKKKKLKKEKKRKKRKQTNKTQTSTGFAHRQPSNKAWGSPSSFFRYNQLKKIKGAFTGLLRCRGDVLYHKNDCILFSNNPCVIWYRNIANTGHSVVALILPIRALR